MLGDPACGKALCGREGLLREMLKHARKSTTRKRHLALAAPRKCGVSSLLVAFARSMPGRNTRLIALNFQQRSIHDLVEQALDALLGAAGTRDGKSARAPRETGGLPERVKQLPKRLAGLGRELLDIWERLGGRLDDAALLERCLRLPAELQQYTRGPVWVLVDHFEGILPLAGDEFIRGPFREALGARRQVRWLLAGTPPALMERLCQGRSAPLSSLMELFTFRGLTFNESLDLLGRHEGARSLSPAHKAFLVALTAGHPFYLELIGAGLDHVRRPGGRRMGPDTLVIEALTRELFAGAGRLQLYFHGLLLESFRGWRAPDLYEGMVEAVARGQTSLAGVSHAIRREAPALSRQVQNLLDSGLVAKEGTLYFIPDPLFRFWVRHVHLSRREGRLLDDAGLQQFQERLRALLSDFLAGYEAETVRRIARVIAASDGKAPVPAPLPFLREGLPIDNLPRFDHVEVMQKLAEETFDIVARRGNEYWAFMVVEVALTESRAGQFIAQVERVRAALRQDCRVFPIILALHTASRAIQRSVDRRRVGLWRRDHINHLAEWYGQLPVLE